MTENLTQTGLNCQDLLAHITENTNLCWITPKPAVRNSAYHQHLAVILSAYYVPGIALVNKQNRLKAPPLGAVHTNASWYLFFPSALKCKCNASNWENYLSGRRSREKALEFNDEKSKTLAGNFTPFCKTAWHFRAK